MSTSISVRKQSEGFFQILETTKTPEWLLEKKDEVITLVLHFKYNSQCNFHCIYQTYRNSAWARNIVVSKEDHVWPNYTPSKVAQLKRNILPTVSDEFLRFKWMQPHIYKKIWDKLFSNTYTRQL